MPAPHRGGPSEKCARIFVEALPFSHKEIESLPPKEKVPIRFNPLPQTGPMAYHGFKR